ncbi:SusC/RagA family TonB-linked outer membrane protein [Spirosoma gilvum]
MSKTLRTYCSLLVFVLCALAGQAQTIQIKGSVSAKNGEPLIGAAILVVGTTTGTVADVDGRFSLATNAVKPQLKVSFIGYTTTTVDVGNATDLKIVLEESSTLDEVVVVGYGTVKKSDLTGAVSSLKAEQLNPGANVSVDQMMQGRAAGVQITQSSSEPGGGLSIRIRGSASINASNEPLYVIDGFPIDNNSNLSAGDASTLSTVNTGTNNTPKNPLNSINPADIQSIEVLKDASATAIYGARGANGVVLITTKKGSGEKMSVNYSAYYGTQSIAKKMNVLTAPQYMKYMNDISADLGQNPIFSSADMAAIGAGTDWQAQVFQSAPVMDHNISLSGGTKKTSVFTSLNYFNQEGIVKNTGINKYIGRINLESALSDNVKVGFNINASLIQDRNTTDGVNTNENGGPVYSSLLYDPTEKIYDANGVLTVSPNNTINNPVSLIVGVSSKMETNRTLGNAYINWEIIKGLSAKLNLGSDRQQSRRDIYNSTLTRRGGPVGGAGDITTFNRNSQLAEYTMTYNKSLNKANVFTILGGVTYQKFQTRMFGGSITGFPTDAIGTDNFGLGNTNNDALRSSHEENTLLSYLGRVNYNLLDKFLFTASVRADGSSRFGENNKFGYFPSVAFGYKLTEEGFLPKVFDELKFRASWGQTGNQEIANYASQLTFGSGPSVVYNNAITTSVIPQRIANPDLKWETTTQFNVGLDGSILNGRLSGTIDYFHKKTTDLLFNLPLPRASGYASILSNVGSVENKGFELFLTSVNMHQKSFKWTTTLNFTSIRNKVLDLGRIEQIVTGDNQAIGGNTVIIKKGEPLASYYGYVVDGIYKTAEEIKTSAEPNAKPGYPKIKDLNGDGKITTADQTVIGTPFPKYTFGMQNSFSYKDFKLDIFFQGSQGANLLNINVIESVYPANFRRNALTEIALERWTTANPDTKWPAGINTSAYGGSKVNSMVMQDASYVRLKSIQLAYQVPLKNTKFIKSLRIYTTGQNLYTWTKYLGFDPEANSYGSSNVRLDYSSYPLARTYLFGLNAGF